MMKIPSLPFVALWASFVAGFSHPSGKTFHSPTRSRQDGGSLSFPASKPNRIGGGGLFLINNSNNINRRANQGVPRGGGDDKTTSTEAGASRTPYDTGTKCPATGFATVAASLWGTGGFLYILGKAIKRVVPVALEPFKEGSVPLSQFELGAYIVTCLWFAYVEGYKGFQQKFSPLVVKRSFTLIPGRNGTRWFHFLLAPFYSMGLMHATKKRKIVSWSVSIGVAAIVAAVKKLPYPWRNIVDAGVVVGLTWGGLSILYYYVKSWMTGKAPPDTDAALPKETTA